MKNRNTYLGGSDLPHICGTTSFTPLELFLEKKGEIKRESNYDMLMGKELEPLIINKYLEEYKSGYKEWEFGDIDIQHPVYPYLKGHLDGWNESKKILLECKSRRFSYETIPLSYLIQCAYYCMIQDASEGHLAILSQTHDFNIFRYERDEDLEKWILSKALEFWERLENNNPPLPISEKEIKYSNQLMYSKIKGIKTGKASEEMRIIINDFLILRENYEESKKVMDEKKLELVNLIGDNQIIENEEGKSILTYKYNKKVTERVDSKKLREEFYEIWEKVKIERSPSRTLRVKGE